MNHRPHLRYDNRVRENSPYLGELSLGIENRGTTLARFAALLIVFCCLSNGLASAELKQSSNLPTVVLNGSAGGKRFDGIGVVTHSNSTPRTSRYKNRMADKARF